MARDRGFRLSWTDAAVLLTAASGSLLAWRSARALAVGIAVAVFHFFLFCNVFRVSRPLELGWAACLLLNVFTLRLLDAFSWPTAMLVQTPITLGILVWTVRSPEYRGIGA